MVYVKSMSKHVGRVTHDRADEQYPRPLVAVLFLILCEFPGLSRTHVYRSLIKRQPFFETLQTPFNDVRTPNYLLGYLGFNLMSHVSWTRLNPRTSATSAVKALHTVAVGLPVDALVIPLLLLCLKNYQRTAVEGADVLCSHSDGP